MAARRRADVPAVAGRWIHLFEEDDAEGAVYVPEATDVPLTRRPRDMIELGRDGEARLFVPGADDRLQAAPGRWMQEGVEIVIESRDGATTRVTIESPTRLRVSR